MDSQITSIEHNLFEMMPSRIDQVFMQRFRILASLSRFWRWLQELNYFLRPVWFVLISTSGITLDSLLLPQSWKFLQNTTVIGFWFQLSHKL